MSTREISEFIRSQYHVEVSAEFISTVTEKVNDDVRQWQVRPLDSVYPVVFFDALRINIRKDGVIKKMAVHLALGVRSDGRRDVLGMWVHENDGAGFWPSVFTELKNRGVRKVIKTRTMFPHEESAKKLIYLALQRIMEKWKLPVRAWSEACRCLQPCTVSDLPLGRLNCRGVLKQ